MKVYLIGAKNAEAARVARIIENDIAKKCGFLDSTPEKKGTMFYGWKVHGWTEVYEEIRGPNTRFLSMVTGTTHNRKKSYHAIRDLGGKFVNFIDIDIENKDISFGRGNWIQEGVIIQEQVEIGDNTSIHIGSMIGHETKIGNHVFIAHAVSISGCCEIGEGALIGTNATILPRLKIGEWATVGAGAVVTKDVPPGAVVVGNPAMIIKK